MAKLNTIDSLFHQWQSNRLSHFYILEAHSSVLEKQEFLKRTITDFLIKVLATERNISPDSAEHLLTQGHGDILFIQKSDKGSEYTIKSGDFDTFFNFLGYGNLELKQRFIIVEDAHLIGKTIANKLLKSLEEPTPNTTIIFLADNTSHMLSTILSRAIKWNLRDQDASHGEFKALGTKEGFVELLNGGNKLSQNMAGYLKGEVQLHELLELVSGKQEYEECFKILLNALSETSSNAKSKEDYLSQMAWWSKAREFHNSPQESLINLLNSLSKF